MKDFIFDVSTRILFGRDQMKNLASEIKKYGSTNTGCAIMKYLKKNYLYRRKFADGIIYLYHQR